MRKYKWWIVALIVSVVTINYFNNYINISFLLGNEFNLITINTVLVGFLFTIYTILIPLLDEETLKSYKVTGEINSVFDNITIGITAGILSVIFTIVGLAIFKTGEGTPIAKLHQIWLTIEISFFLIVMVSTLISVINVSTIVEDIRRDKDKKSSCKKVDEEMEKRFKNK